MYSLLFNGEPYIDDKTQRAVKNRHRSHIIIKAKSLSSRHNGKWAVFDHDKDRVIAIAKEGKIIEVNSNDE